MNEILSDKQKGVKRGAIGALVFISLIFALQWFDDTSLFYESLSKFERAKHIAIAELLIILTLVISVVRVGNQRFGNLQDIDGAGLTSPSKNILILRAILQNTLEQCCIAILVHACWVIIMPAAFLPYCFGAILCFVVGRVLFTLGYEKGSSGRAMGFGLTFYPSVIMLAVMIIYVVGNSSYL